MQDIPPHAGEHSDRDPGEHSPEGRWLTYIELGRIRGIGRESAVKLAQRKRWRRIPGNDGVARVFVPPDWLTPASAPPAKPSREYSPEHSPEHRHLLAGAIAALEDAVIGLREQLRSREAELSDANRRTDEAVTRADRAESAIAGERQRADALRERIDGLQHDLTAAQVIAQEARAEAKEAAQALDQIRRADTDEARKARGLVARLRAALRGE